MKRIASLIMMIVVLLIVVQPAVAFHFCGSNLIDYSITSASVDDCCKKQNQAPTQEKNTVEKQSCCTTVEAEMHTDHYTVEPGVHFDHNLALALFVIEAFTGSFFSLEERTNDNAFPSPPLNALQSGRDILVSKCVFII